MNYMEEFPYCFFSLRLFPTFQEDIVIAISLVE